MYIRYLYIAIVAASLVSSFGDDAHEAEKMVQHDVGQGFLDVAYPVLFIVHLGFSLKWLLDRDKGSLPALSNALGLGLFFSFSSACLELYIPWYIALISDSSQMNAQMQPFGGLTDLDALCTGLMWFFLVSAVLALCEVEGLWNAAAYLLRAGVFVFCLLRSRSENASKTLNPTDPDTIPFTLAVVAIVGFCLLFLIERMRKIRAENPNIDRKRYQYTALLIACSSSMAAALVELSIVSNDPRVAILTNTQILQQTTCMFNLGGFLCIWLKEMPNYQQIHSKLDAEKAPRLDSSVFDDASSCSDSASLNVKPRPGVIGAASESSAEVASDRRWPPRIDFHAESRRNRRW